MKRAASSALEPAGQRLGDAANESGPASGPRLAPWRIVPVVSEDAASIARRIQAGDTSAEPVLVERFGRGVRTTLRHAAREASLVDDLYQETFRVALERIRAGGLREPAQLGAFLAGLARHLTTEHFRRMQRSEAEDPSVLERIEAPECSSVDAIAQRQLAELVRLLLEELPTDRDREVLRRFYLTSDDKDLICADLSLTRLQFNRVLHRARERFRALWVSKSKTGTPWGDNS
jgi:RNA polymerase sigma-70 factor (ECF subfamily)